MSLLSNAELMSRLESFAEEERERLHAFVAWLGEADRRQAFVDFGFHSTFDYCVRKLKLSEDEACRRIQAARAGVARPELLSAMAGGRLSLTAASRIAPLIERPDAVELISRAEGKTIRQLDDMLAPLKPEPAKRDVMRVISEIREEPVASFSKPTTAPETRVEFSFRGPTELRDAVERARELLAHKFPMGELGDVLLEVARDYLSRHDPQASLSFGPGVRPKGSSILPVASRRAVWARDGGRCSYIGADGARCTSRWKLEIDHRTPRSLGGGNEPGNLRLLCRAHNGSERRRLLGG